MKLRVLDTGQAPARWNVAMSAALLKGVDEGGPATLRFHRYPAACVIGRNQDAGTELDLVACRAGGFEVARRVTGGGAVVMGPGILAFDLVLPVAPRDALAVSRRAGETLATSLRTLGFAAVLVTSGSIEIEGRKVSGSAGRLGRRAALHQATLILDLAQAAPLSLLRRRTEGGRPTADPRHRVTDLASQFVRGQDSTATTAPDPSSVTASRRPLLPQREKGFGSGVERRLIDRLAAAFALTPEPDQASTAERARASSILATTVGRDDFVFEGDLDERRAA